MARNLTLCSCLSFLLISHMVLAQSDNYIIHMDLKAMPKVFSDHHSWYLATLSSLLDNSGVSTVAKLLYSYTHVINGFSANLLPEELEALKASPGFIYSTKDLPLKAATTHSPKFLGLNTNSGVWPMSNYGENVIIGVVDSGIWPESESFRDDEMPDIPSRWKGECVNGIHFNSSMCNRKLIGARIFNDGQKMKTKNTPRDLYGHGTIVSSIAAGNYVQGAAFFGYASGTASGVAPRAHIAMYKAIWDVYEFSETDFLAAIDQAVEDGVDVLSLSFALPGSFPFYDDTIAIASFAAMEKGIFVSASAGNEGPEFKSVRNGTPWVLTVAAGRMDREFSGIINLGNGISVRGWSLYPANSSSIHLPIVFMDGCHNIKELARIGNKIVVCEDKNDTLTLSHQIRNIQHAKVAGGVFITNNTSLEFKISTSFPSTFLNPKDGEIIKNYTESELDPKAILAFNITNFGTKPAPSVAGYSSRGPSPNCPAILKPDVMAPGSLVLASTAEYNPVAWLNQRAVYSKFLIMSGTSVACPHAAGVAALLKSAHPEWSPAAIRSAIMTTSDALDNTLNPIKDVAYDYQPATPLAMGAGHINPNKALDPGLVYDAGRDDYINLLCALNYTHRRIKLIVRSDSFNCSTPSLDLNYPSFIAFFNANQPDSDSKTHVQEFQRTVTNVGEPRETYVASVTPMNGFEVKVVPEKLVFKEQNQKLSFKLIVQGPSLMKERVAFGYLRWVDSKNKLEVRSPIVATNLD